MHPVLLSFGPIHLYSYGVLVAIGVLSAVLLLRSSANQISIDPETVVDLAIATVVSGFVGARIFYVIQFWDYFRSSPFDVVKIWEGGIVLYGGLIGGLIGFSVFIWVKRLPFLVLLDLFVPGMSLAQGFGRIGCFLNGCCYGKVTTVPWAISFPFLDHPVHPTQLYEATFCFSLALFLLFLWRKHLAVGTVSFAYFTLYPLGRFSIEFFRGDNARIFLNLTLSQWISLIIMISASLLFVSFRSHYGRKTADRPS